MHLQNQTVSIVIPTKNNERTIIRCIESCRFQSYDDIEIIIVDRGSNDKTLDLALHEAEQDDRISVITLDDKMFGYAVQTGINYSTGKYIARLNATDYQDYRRIETLVHNYNDEGVLLSNVWIVDETKIRTRVKIFKPSLFKTGKQRIFAETLFMSKSILQSIGQYHPTYDETVDKLWIRKALNKDLQFKIIYLPLYYVDQTYG